jgi:hypothetical protein
MYVRVIIFFSNIQMILEWKHTCMICKTRLVNTCICIIVTLCHMIKYKNQDQQARAELNERIPKNNPVPPARWENKSKAYKRLKVELKVPEVLRVGGKIERKNMGKGDDTLPTVDEITRKYRRMCHHICM